MALFLRPPVSFRSESPFSEPGALEEAEPDGGTETQTSDEGTCDPPDLHAIAHATPSPGGEVLLRQQQPWRHVHRPSRPSPHHPSLCSFQNLLCNSQKIFRAVT